MRVRVRVRSHFGWVYVCSNVNRSMCKTNSSFSFDSVGRSACPLLAFGWNNMLKWICFIHSEIQNKILMQSLSKPSLSFEFLIHFDGNGPAKFLVFAILRMWSILRFSVGKPNLSSLGQNGFHWIQFTIRVYYKHTFTPKKHNTNTQIYKHNNSMQPR